MNLMGPLVKSFGHVRSESLFHNLHSSEKSVYVLGKEVRGFCFVHVCQSVVLSLCGGWVFLRPCHHLKGLQWRSVGGIGGCRVNSQNAMQKLMVKY